jgi:hypothetical protein
MDEAQRVAQRKLILHFDVNETIMLGDRANGDTLEDSLNKIVCKSAYVRGCEGGVPTQWYDGSCIDGNMRPPPLLTGCDVPGVVEYYRAGRDAAVYRKEFTEKGMPGEAYRYEYNAMEAALRWPSGRRDAPPDRRLCCDKHFVLIPAFFHTISTLAREGRSFGVVVRTFGFDAEAVAGAINAFAEGRYLSTEPAVPAVHVGEGAIWHGSYARDGAFRLRQGRYDLCESEAVAALEARDRHISCAVCTDDHAWWSKHGCEASAGKPVWLTRDDRACQHIFFDDGIRSSAGESIVAVRVRESAGQAFRTLSGAEALLEHGVHLVRTPTIEPILDESWFLEEIAKCEAALGPATGTRT